MQKAARTIVDSRKLIFVIFLIAVLVSGFAALDVKRLQAHLVSKGVKL